MLENEDAKTLSKYAKTINSPLGIFVLVLLTCNMVFTVCATILGNANLFVYSMHMFLAIIALFGIVAIYNPFSLYSPHQIGGYIKELNKDKTPWVPLAAMLTSLAMYIGYQAYKVKVSSAESRYCLEHALGSADECKKISDLGHNK